MQRQSGPAVLRRLPPAALRYVRPGRLRPPELAALELAALPRTDPADRAALPAAAAGAPGDLADEAAAAFQFRLIVADHAAASRVAAELARNRRAALARGAGAAPPLAVVGAVLAGAVAAAPAVIGDAVIMPGGHADAVRRRCETRLVIGPPAGAVIVVPGTAADQGGVHALTPETFGRLRRAEQLARRGEVRAVILSGWNGPAALGRTEAEQMLRAWSGPDVPVICDEAARTTAENALCAAAIIGSLGGVGDVVVVASWANALRLRLAFRAALRPHGLRAGLSTVWGRGHGASWRPGLAGLPRVRRHLRAGQALLDAALDAP
jgi:uncharacterized SAM-binding protein YcdF (DUF218 family)